jgi:hypothetical protein
MITQFVVRYGRNYKVVLALVLPPTALIPAFFFVMNAFKPMNEWLIWLSITIFLGTLIWLCIWLALRLYPKTILTINDLEISLLFDQTNLIAPRDFTFHVTEITSFTRGEIRGDEYFLIQTKNPFRKFQVSSSSYEIKEMIAFNKAMVKISELMNPVL